MVLGFGCGDDDASSSGDAGPLDSGVPGEAVLRVATFNAGLLDTVGFVPERRPLVNDALAELDSDVLCVQEVWQDDDWDAVVNANEDVRPHAERIEPMPGVPGLCTPEELLPLRECSELMCPGAGPSDLFACTVSMCVAEVGALSATCTSCLVDNGASGDLEVIELACLGSAADEEDLPLARRPLVPARGAFGLASSPSCH